MTERHSGYFILRLMHLLKHSRHSSIPDAEQYQRVYQDSRVRIRLLGGNYPKKQIAITVELVQGATPEVWEESEDDVLVFRACNPRADIGEPQAKEFPDWVADINTPGEWIAYLERVSVADGFWMF